MRVCIVSSNLSFIFHHSQAILFVFWHFCICQITTVGGVGRETYAGHMRAAPAIGGGVYPPPSSTTTICYMCTAITWTSTDTSTSSTKPFIIIKFKNTAFSEIIMNEWKNVDDKRIVYVYSNFDSCLYVSLFLSFIIIMRTYFDQNYILL